MRRLKVLPLCLAFLAFLFLTIKLYLYDNLAYTSDFFGFLQMSQTWLTQGKFMFENAWGYHSGIHNYYFILLFAPLTLLLAGKGLVLGLFLLWSLTVYKLYKNNQLNPFVKNTFYFSFLFSPMGFWLWDHPLYGWHLELLFLPLSLLLVLSYLEKNKLLFIASILALFLLREDAPVLFCSIALGYIYINQEHRNLKNYVKIVAASLLALVVSLLLLKWNQNYFGVDGAGRLSSSLQQFQSSLAQGALPLYWSNIKNTLLLLGASALPLFALLPRNLFKSLVVFSIVSLPLYFILILAAQNYGLDDIYHGLFWPPRFNLLVGLFWSIIFITLHKQNISLSSVQKISFVVLIFFAYMIQIDVLQKNQKYNITPRLFSMMSSFKAQLPSHLLSAEEKASLSCLSKELPKHSSILSNGYLFRLFERHNLLWIGRSRELQQLPSIIVCLETPQFGDSSSCLEEAKLNTQLPLHFQKNQLHIWHGPESSQTLRTCFKEGSPAP